MIKIELILDFLSLIAVALSAYLIYVQIKKQFEWNKRKATQDLLFKLVSGDFLQIRNLLETIYRVNILDKSQSYSILFKGLTNDKDRIKFTNNVKYLFNYFETVSLGIKNNLLDEDMCYEYLSLIMVKYWNWASDEIDRYRSFNRSNFIETRAFVERWEKRLLTEDEVHPNPGKPPI